MLLDSGATVECRPQHLVQFAVMGAAYARVALGCASPRVGLLSVGEEESKGNELTREAHQLLKSAPIDFVGNVEGRHVYAGDVDVIVCDGFTGNVTLKISEGLVDDGRDAAARRAVVDVRHARRLPAVAAGVPPIPQARRCLRIRRRAARRPERPLRRRSRPLVGEGGAERRGDGGALRQPRGWSAKLSRDIAAATASEGHIR